MKIFGVFSVTAEMTSRVRLIRSGDQYTTARSISHDRISHSARSLSLSCHSEMQNAAVCNCGWCTRLLEERHRFPHVAYVTTYIKALLPVQGEGEEKKERERILLRAERHASVLPILHSRTPSSPNSERTDKLYRVRGEATKKWRGRDSKSKGSIKSCRCVSRAQQRGRCQKGLPRDSIYRGSGEPRSGDEDGKPFRSSAES